MKYQQIDIHNCLILFYKKHIVNFGNIYNNSILCNVLRLPKTGGILPI